MAQSGEATSIEHNTEQIQRGVDDAPRDVASERRDQEIAARAFAFAEQHAGTERERERHDQPEQELAESLTRREIFVDEAEHAARRYGSESSRSRLVATIR